MPSIPTQFTRVGRLDTPLGSDTLVLVRFDGDEGMSELFEYRIEALSTREAIDFQSVKGQNCCVTLKTYGAGQRFFNGVLVEGQATGVQQNLFSYRLVLRPWTWVLSRAADCRIYEKMNVIDIVEDVFKRRGFKDYSVKANRGDYDKIEYLVQYRETDLAFISRLMEEWGIYTFFQHSRDKHVLVLADSFSCHSNVDVMDGTVPFIPLTGDDRRDSEHLYHWSAERRFRTQSVTVRDFDYMKPASNLEASDVRSKGADRPAMEAYDYPGRYKEVDLGRKRAKVRLEAETALDGRRYASGDAVSLHPGGLVKMKRHPYDDGQYLVVRSSHAFVSEAYTTGGGSGGGEIYHGHYELQRSDVQYRAPLVTPRPLVHGPQTAMVTTRKGKESEEIDVDEEGRIFVQFHWNREKNKISRPVRVAQMWAGKSWGWQVIPRVGQEVIVEFLEGDPDEPIVTGAVYNQRFPYPYPLPDKKNISGVKSDSTKGHGGYNEFIFDDTKGKELIGVHAQKDADTVIEHDETRLVKHDRTTTIEHDDTKKVDHDWTVNVGHEIHIKAGTKIVIEVGASKITMDSSTIKIESGQITVEGTAEIIEKAPFIKLN